MSYRGQHEPIELTGFGVAVLAGENGSGKSSLLDSITWVLWGRSRAGSSSDPLVSAGESEMAVDMEFTSNDSKYRVIRRHRKPTIRSKTGLTSLDLQAWDGNQFRSLTDSSIRGTQRSLVKLIGLDYETFVNTSYFAQGRADLFSTKTPAERKKLLGEILGLDSYGQLSSESRAEAREREIQSRVFASRIESINNNQVSEDDLNSKILALGTQISDMNMKSNDKKAQINKMNEKIAIINQSLKGMDDLSQGIDDLEKQHKALENSRATTQKEIDEANIFLKRSEQISKGYQSLLQVRSELADLGEKAGQLANLEARRNRVDSDIAKQTSTYQEKIAILNSEIKSIEKTQTKYETLKESTDQLRNNLDILAVKWQENERHFTELSHLTIDVERLMMTKTNLENDLESIYAKQNMLSNNEHDACPLCGNELSEHNSSQVLEHYASETSAANLNLSKVISEISEKQGTMKILNTSAMKEKTELTTIIKESEGRLNRQNLEEERIKDGQTRLISLKAALIEISAGEDEFLIDEKKEAQRIELEINDLDYDFQKHKTLQKENDEISHYEDEYLELSNIQQLDKHKKALLGDIVKRLSKSQVELEHMNTNLAKLRAQRKMLRDAEQNLNGLEIELTRHVADQESKTKDRDEFVFTLQQLEKDKTKSLEFSDLKRRSLEEKAVYDELSVAFGVKGVQALLVETAVPQIERDANQLLGRMTDNRMNIRLVTQRQTKTGEASETLDILIGDEWGTRSYELYSGGENFRIDFALRIALSKLLSRRSGTKVPLIFIDEGFGTQDQTGKNRLVEAISSLREDIEFENGLILVITHLEDIISQFDIRIQIEKNEYGSSISFV